MYRVRIRSYGTAQIGENNSKYIPDLLIKHCNFMCIIMYARTRYVYRLNKWHSLKIILRFPYFLHGRHT